MLDDVTILFTIPLILLASFGAAEVLNFNASVSGRNTGLLIGAHLLQLAAELLHGAAAECHTEPVAKDHREPVRPIR
jgi:hypothetical protein